MPNWRPLADGTDALLPTQRGNAGTSASGARGGCTYGIRTSVLLVDDPAAAVPEVASSSAHPGLLRDGNGRGDLDGVATHGVYMTVTVMVSSGNASPRRGVRWVGRLLAG
jgi:hypothetical protein